MPYDDDEGPDPAPPPAHRTPKKASPKPSPQSDARADAMGGGPRQIVDPDNRALNSRKTVFEEFPEEGGGQGGGPPEDIPTALQAEADPIINDFGLDVAKLLFSKNWQNRDEGIAKTMKALPAKANSSRVVGGILKRMLNDKNPTVYLSSLGLLREYVDMSDADIRGALDKALEVMVSKLGESNTKVKTETATALLHVASLPQAGPSYVAPPVLKPPKQTNVWKPVLARLEFLEQLLAEHESTPANGLGLEAVMPMVVVGLNSSNADTRNKGIEVVEQLSAVHGRKVDPFLKGVTSEATKKVVKEKLAEAQGKPPPPKPQPVKRGLPPGAKPGGSKPAPAGKGAGGAGAKADPEPADEVEKVAWYRKKAEGGDADAQYNLAICYEEGKGVGKSEPEAARWFARAAEQGDADAQFSLGVCYHEGKGLEKDDAKAIELWTKAAQQGNEDAKFILGISEES